jgi:hypothetical protein
MTRRLGPAVLDLVVGLVVGGVAVTFMGALLWIGWTLRGLMP